MMKLLLLALASSAFARLPTATIKSGTLIGTTTSVPSATATVNKFLGIPFAASPVRFVGPSTPTAWSEPLNVSAVKPACIQQINYPEAQHEFSELLFNSPQPAESEDCLYLNVFAPSTTPPLGGFTVMFWIYGGGFAFGNAGQPQYDGSNFAAFQDVILVSSNYRTNVFGFPNSPELPLTGQNLGLLDQRFALEWVQENIQAFGGNPSKVTIFGQSAGAQSVDALITSYSKNVPFRAGILQSGQSSVKAPGAPATTGWSSLTTLLNCTEYYTSNLTCVRAASVDTLRSILENNTLSFSPIVDDVTFLSDPAAARALGNFAAVPVLAGGTNNDGSIFVYGQDNLTAFLETGLPDLGLYQDILAGAYAVGTTNAHGYMATDFDSIDALYTDLIGQCPQAITLDATVAKGVPSWRYIYNATFPNIEPVPDLGAWHSSEIMIIFGTFPQAGATAQEYELSKFLQAAWANFAKDPSSGPGWEQLGTLDFNDLALLGANGSSGATLITTGYVDKMCNLFAPIYLDGAL